MAVLHVLLVGWRNSTKSFNRSFVQTGLKGNALFRMVSQDFRASGEESHGT
jgi:hypothetical protein